MLYLALFAKIVIRSILQLILTSVVTEGASPFFPLQLLLAVPIPELGLVSAGSSAELIQLTNPAESYALSGGF